MYENSPNPENWAYRQKIGFCIAVNKKDKVFTTYIAYVATSTKRTYIEKCNIL